MLSGLHLRNVSRLGLQLVGFNTHRPLEMQEGNINECRRDYMVLGGSIPSRQSWNTDWRTSRFPLSLILKAERKHVTNADGTTWFRSRGRGFESHQLHW